MIDLQQIVGIVLYILVAGAIFGLLYYLCNYFERKFPGNETVKLFVNVAEIFLVVLAVLVIIGILLSLVGGVQLFRWGGPR